MIGTNSKIDVIYPYRRLTHGDAELKYSLRSLCENGQFRNVYIVGDRPGFASDELKVIEYHGESADSQRNCLERVLKICSINLISTENRPLSSNIVVFNDDFFLLRTYKCFPYFYKGTLGQAEQDRDNNFKGRYYKLLQGAMNRHGEDALNYETHFPIQINRNELIRLNEKYGKNPLLWRTAYCKDRHITGDKTFDWKAYNFRQFDHYLNVAPFMSVTNEIGSSDRFKQKMDRRFPDKCRFEL